MNTKPQTIEDILHDMYLEATSKTSPFTGIPEAKQALREAVLTEVIGSEQPGVTNVMVAMEHQVQRHRLDAWLGLEDTSNE